MAEDIQLRRYKPRDSDAVVTLDAWALGETQTDPEDIPGREDIHDIEATYLDSGGDFVVGLCKRDSECGRRLGERARTVETDDGATVETGDGCVVAMGGFLPSAAGHDDERTVAGAAELHRMRVAPPCQRRGYGAALLADLEARAAAAGFERALATTAARQQAAVAFYPAHGYDRVGTATYGAYDLVHFEKKL
jgi:GNAT superfamily N-acetyltransferase